MPSQLQRITSGPRQTLIKRYIGRGERRESNDQETANTDCAEASLVLFLLTLFTKTAPPLPPHPPSPPLTLSSQGLTRDNVKEEKRGEKVRRQRIETVKEPSWSSPFCLPKFPPPPSPLTLSSQGLSQDNVQVGRKRTAERGERGRRYGEQKL